MKRLPGVHWGLVLVALACAGCGDDDDVEPTVDATVIAVDASAADAGTLDAAHADAAVTWDAAPPDAPTPDAAAPPDAPTPDAAAPPDAPTPDAAAPPDAAPTVCRNFDAAFPGGLDGVRECLVTGELCYPDAPTSDYGVCRPGDGCDFVAQTGCDAAKTCHPAASFGMDNTDATICIDAGAGGLYAPCGATVECAVGFTCIAVGEGSAACLPYCSPDAPVCPDGTSCVDLSLQFIPAVRPSYPVGVCG